MGTKSGAKSFMCYISPRIHQRFHACYEGNPLPLCESFFPLPLKHLQDENASKVTAFHQSTKKSKMEAQEGLDLKHHPTICDLPVAYRLLMLISILRHVIIMILYYIISKNNKHELEDWINDKMLGLEKWMQLHNKLPHIWKWKCSPTLLLESIPFNPFSGTTKGNFFPS